ncbi:MAG TPA: zinc ribbon domain-containing protein [Desulfosalsimonadaceae bacterium]|nr:zinc ribbon domain-containing protein [Desulfosalsimonadaceae bacterium]
MPIYEFVCEQCDHQFEELVSLSDTSYPRCPKCQSEQVRKKISACGIRPNGIPTGSGGFKPPACATGG